MKIFICKILQKYELPANQVEEILQPSAMDKKGIWS